MTEKLKEQYVNGEKAIVDRWPWLVAIKWTFDKIGLPFLLIMFGLGVWSGLIESPLTTLAETMVEHTAHTEELIKLLKLRDQYAQQ